MLRMSSHAGDRAAVDASSAAVVSVGSCGGRGKLLGQPLTRAPVRLHRQKTQ